MHALLVLLFVIAARAEPPILRLSLEAPPTTLDWNARRSPRDRFLASFLMRGMLKYDAANRPVCDLCQSMAVSADGRVHRFKLATGARWSDGRPLEAAHFVDSFRRMLDPAHGFPCATEFSGVRGAVQKGKFSPTAVGARAQGKDTLEIELTHPSATFLHLMTSVCAYPVRRDLARRPGQPDDRGIAMATRATLGPYSLAAWEKNRIVIEGNPSYEGERPVYRVEFLMGPPKEMEERFRAGRLEILSNPTTETLLQHPAARAQVSPSWATRLLYVNTRRPPYSDGNMRRAVQLALDRAALPGLLRNGDRPCVGLVPPGLVGSNVRPPEAANLSRGQAERHRAVAWPRWADAKLIAGEGAAEARMVEWIKLELAKIHIRVTPRILGEAEFYRALHGGEFDLALATWAHQTASPLDVFRMLGGPNPAGWSNAAYSALLREAESATTQDALLAAITRMETLLATREVPVIPLSHPTYPFLLGARVQSFGLTPMGDPDLVRVRLAGPTPSSVPAGTPSAPVDKPR